MTSTGGFDLVAQIRAPFVGDIFKSYYDVGSIPHNTTVDLSKYGYGQAQVTLNAPLLWIDTDVEGEVEFIGTAQVVIGELSFEVSLDDMLTPTIQNVNGVETGVITLDNTNLTVSVPASVPNYQTLEQILAPAISQWLASQSPFVVILPSIPKPFNNVQVVPIDDSAEMGRTNVSIGLSVMETGDTNKVPIFILPAEDFAVVFSAPLIDATIEGAISNALGGSLPQPLPGASNVTLNHLNLSLIEGGFSVSGDVSVNTGFLGISIGVGFSGSVGINLNPDGTVNVISNIQISESVWFWVISFLLGGIPLIVAEVVLQVIADNILNSAINSAGSSSLSGKNVFSTSLPQIGAGGVITITTIITRLEMHVDSMVLGGKATLSPT